MSALSFDGERAIELVTSGRTIKEASEAVGTSYGDLYHFLRRRGITGGKIMRDRRSLEDKVREITQFHPNGCITFLKRRSFSKQVYTSVHFFKVLFGYEFKPVPPLRACTTAFCYNPEHYWGKNANRDAEIRAAWRRYEESKTTLQKLGDTYGLTRERIRQIIAMEVKS